MLNLVKLAREICTLHLDDSQGMSMERVVLALSNSVEELNFFVGFHVVTREFEVPGNLIIRMPEDCIQVVKVGVLCDDVIRVMGKNNAITKLEEVERTCGCTEDIVCDAHTFHNYTVGDYSEYYEAYGKRQNQFPNGYYRYSPEKKTVSLSSGSGIYDGSKIVVEYHTSLNNNSLAMIPNEYKPIITYHALSMLFMRSNPGLSASFRQQLRNSAELVKRAQQPALTDILGVLRGEAHNGVK